MYEYFEETRLVRTYDVDINNRLKLSSIFNIMQDIAADHAELLNVGYKSIKEINLVWMLSWAKVKITRYPAFGDVIKIKTWPKCKYKLYSMRDFYIYDQDNNIIINASTAWLLFNSLSKRITDLHNLKKDIKYFEEDKAIIELPERIKTKGNPEIVLTKTFKYSDLDLNLHVNNSKYFELITDVYTNEFHNNNKLKSAAVSFISEIKYDETIDIILYNNHEEKSKDIIAGVNQKENKQVFTAELEWEAVE